ncbi:MAG: hypothetical protein A2W99_11790 [Bacteroidetes bacterium GWF2_33_16]|nr:MAG: hypothetical protein A2X00_02485 [Bacteroidetes bacterium GWE2_32_14]OFY06380.1 MAG: hypothetical protein A2W99_11790 [Bacteroidetes bacterium GWF2_33_16]
MVLIGLILFSPFFFRIFKIPDVASFIIVGVLIGPYSFNILSNDSSIELLGTVGLLYIMFIAGLELNPERLKTSMKNSILFGFSTFIFPFILGYIISSYVLHLELYATLLVSIMFSTHTLVAYPIVRKLGVTKDISVLTAVGGTIITDTMVLMILSILTQDFQSDTISFQVLKLMFFFFVYIFFIFYSFPRIARWFFKYIKRDRPVHFLFLLFMLCFSSFLAEIIGLEAIIGAFVAGLALNKSIPKNSLLMHHVDFVGNVLFIPVFLIGIGMLINTQILISGTYLWFVSGVLVISAFAGKWIAAFISQKILKFNNIQRNLLFGLTSSHAAATIAIILIGFEKHMIDETIFNATILIILISSLTATFITERFGKKLAVTIDTSIDENFQSRILVPISNPSTMKNLVEIANSFQSIHSSQPVYVLNILNDNKSSRENILNIREVLESNISEFNNLKENLKVITRVDLNISSGILMAAKEYLVSDIVFGWVEKTTATQRVFGNIFDHLINGSQTLFAVKIQGGLEDIRKTVINIPFNLEHESSFASIISRINNLPVSKDVEIEYRCTNEESLKSIKALQPRRHKQHFNYLLLENNMPENYRLLSNLHTLNVMFILRSQSIAYSAKHNIITKKIIESNNSNNYIIIVPGYGQI